MLTPAPPVRCPEQLYQGYIFDLDGTIYLGDEVLPGARRLVAALRDLGKSVLFLSNNPTRDLEAYARKLTGMGIPASPSQILNTVQTMTRWLVHHHPRATVFPIAEAPLVESLQAAGIRLSDDPAEIDFVIASYDRTFDYRKLQIAFDAIWYHKRARLIATNPDVFCPYPGGRGQPDAGAIIAAIEACTGARCEVVTGKPDPIMLAAALEVLGLPPEACVIAGDRLATDVRMGVNSGMPSALVLTGATTPQILKATPATEQPTYVLERIDQLLPASIWEQRGWTLDNHSHE